MIIQDPSLCLCTFTINIGFTDLILGTVKSLTDIYAFAQQCHYGIGTSVSRLHEDGSRWVTPKIYIRGGQKYKFFEFELAESIFPFQ